MGALFHGLDEDDCRIWFGVGIGTLERIETGEVEPGDELERRIAFFLKSVRAALSPLARTPGSPVTHSGEPTGGAGAVAPARAAIFAGGRR